VRGTWNLHDTAGRQQAPLHNYFTLLYSILGLVGQRGQINYAAANTFLDAFAAFRRARSQRATAVDLDVIANVGYLADKAGRMAPFFNARLWPPISECALRLIFDMAVAKQAAALADAAAAAAQLDTGIALPLPANAKLLRRSARFTSLAFTPVAAEAAKWRKRRKRRGRCGGGARARRRHGGGRGRAVYAHAALGQGR
jgi:hypothetical protein